MIMNVFKFQKNINKTPNKYNYGFGILKVILAFYVICGHNFNSNTTKSKLLLYILRRRRIHVPCFFIMSFLFLSKELMRPNIVLYFKRIERLLIPYFFWPSFIFFLNNYVCVKLYKYKKYSFRDLKDQFIWGDIFVGQFWFQWVLILLTTIFYIIRFITKNHFLFCIQILTFLSYIIQYTGIDKKIDNSLAKNKRLTVGRINVMIPFAGAGVTLAFLNIIETIKLFRIKTMIFCILIFRSLDKYDIFSDLKGAVAYPGIKLYFRANCLIFFFSIFPSEKITNIKIQKILKHITNYTTGVYYLHITIIYYFKEFIRPIKEGNIYGCIIVYLICYIISFIGASLAGKTKFKFLF